MAGLSERVEQMVMWCMKGPIVGIEEKVEIAVAVARGKTIVGGENGGSDTPEPRGSLASKDERLDKKS